MPLPKSLPAKLLRPYLFYAQNCCRGDRTFVLQRKTVVCKESISFLSTAAAGHNRHARTRPLRPWSAPVNASSSNQVAEIMGVVVTQAIRTGRDKRGGCSQRCDNLLGGAVCSKCAPRHISGAGGLLQGAIIILLPLFAILTRTVHCGSPIHLCPGVCVQLYRLLVLWF